MLQAVRPPRQGGLPCPAVRLACSAAIIAVMMAASGCAHFNQTQYFEVRTPPDPITGAVQRNYYKTTLSGTGWMQKKYNMRAAYMSKAALDSLRGAKIEIPVIDMPNQNEEAFNDIKKSYLENAQSAAYVLSGRTDKDPAQKPADEKPKSSESTTTGTTTVTTETPKDGPKKVTTKTDTTVIVTEPKPADGRSSSGGPEGAAGTAALPGQDDTMLGIARQAWFAYLSDGDIISMGETRKTDPYQFRKLVFYTSASNIDLSQYSDEIDSAISKVEGLARGFKNIRDAQREAERARRDAAIKNAAAVISTLPGPQQAAVQILCDTLLPATTESAAK